MNETEQLARELHEETVDRIFGNVNDVKEVLNPLERCWWKGRDRLSRNLCRNCTGYDENCSGYIPERFYEDCRGRMDDEN